MSVAICSAQDVRRRFGATDALRGVSFELHEAGLHAIIGPSGSGKTTLLNLLTGLDRPDAGTVTLCGLRIDSLSARRRAKLRAKHVGIVFQRFNLIGSLTARQNIELPARARSERPDPAWVDRLVSSVGIAEVISRYPAELSGGQQQRVGIARSLVSGPRVLFADEPTGSLDHQAGLTVLQLLRDLSDELNLAVAIVTHDHDLARHCDAVTALRDGRVVDEAPPEPPPCEVDGAANATTERFGSLVGPSEPASTESRALYCR